MRRRTADNAGSPVSRGGSTRHPANRAVVFFLKLSFRRTQRKKMAGCIAGRSEKPLCKLWPQRRHLTTTEYIRRSLPGNCGRVNEFNRKPARALPNWQQAPAQRPPAPISHPPPCARWPGALESWLAGHRPWVLVWTGACYWHGMGGFVFNSSSSHHHRRGCGGVHCAKCAENWQFTSVRLFVGGDPNARNRQVRLMSGVG